MLSLKGVASPRKSVAEIEDELNDFLDGKANKEELLVSAGGNSGRKYEPLEIEPAQHRGDASEVATLITLFKSFVGLGVLAIPHAYTNAGWLLGSVALLVSAWFSYYSILLLVRADEHLQRHGASSDADEFETVAGSADRDASPGGGARGGGAGGAHGSFENIAGSVGGPRARKAARVSLVITQFGFATSYLIFIGDTAVHALPGVFSTPAPCIFLVGLALIPLVMLRSLGALSKFSLLANVSILCGLAACFTAAARAITHRGGGAHPAVRAALPRGPSAFGLFFGIAVFAYEGIGMVLPVRAEMRDPRKFQPVMFTVIVACE